jgi:uncharacterized secreted protein with C-terminal beta-propeller domain
MDHIHLEEQAAVDARRYNGSIYLTEKRNGSKGPNIDVADDSAFT